MRRILLAVIVVTPLVLSPSHARMFFVLETPVYETSVRVGSGVMMWGDAFTDPNDPYRIRVDIEGPEGIVIDPNTGTHWYLSNTDPNYLAMNDLPADPNMCVYWGVTWYPGDDHIGVHDITVTAVEHPIESVEAILNKKIMRVTVLPPKIKPTIRIGGCTIIR